MPKQRMAYLRFFYIQIHYYWRQKNNFVPNTHNIIMDTFYIKLSSTENSARPHPLPVCASKFWGDPDLPKGMPYPSQYIAEWDESLPYHFICQINLADLPPQDLLPSEGLLQFYANIHYYLGWDGEPEIGSCLSRTDDVRVLYFPDANPAGFEPQIVVDEEDENCRLFPHELALSFTDKLSFDHPQHHLLGFPEFREWEDWDEPCQGWRLLLQVDSFDGPDFNLNFMDTGVLNFLISENDLKQRNFDQVRAIILST